jgi:hypothetical protein
VSEGLRKRDRVSDSEEARVMLAEPGGVRRGEGLSVASMVAVRVSARVWPGVSTNVLKRVCRKDKEGEWWREPSSERVDESALEEGISLIELLKK